MKKSTKTTIFGGSAGVAMIGQAVQKAFENPEGTGLCQLFEGEAFAPILAGVGLILMGLFARDDDVSSEGTKAAKIK